MRKVKFIIWRLYSIYSLLTTWKEDKESNLLNSQKTIDYVINKKRSLIRLGDGEFRILLRKKGISYQEYSEKLYNELWNVVKEYMEENCIGNYILCLPYEFFKVDFRWFMKNPLTYMDHWAYIRKYFRKKMNTNKIYGDAFLFSQGMENEYKQLWTDKKEVIFVHRDEKYAIEFQEKYNIKCTYIQIPEKNCYEEIDKIEYDIKSKIKSTDKYTIPILISAGPTAKILVYRLSKDGYIAYDTGHCWDEPLYMPK